MFTPTMFSRGRSWRSCVFDPAAAQALATLISTSASQATRDCESWGPSLLPEGPCHASIEGIIYERDAEQVIIQLPPDLIYSVIDTGAL